MPTMPVLDKGYITLIETWGSEERIIESARMSTNKGFQGWGTDEKPSDEKLLKYLYTHKHHTPFEMAGATFEVQAPIFVFREWHRHRTQSYNEMSARYIQMPNLHYMPDPGRVRGQSILNKQGTGLTELDPSIVSEWRYKLEKEQQGIYDTYEWALANGIPKELARINTPVSRYSRMRASANLRNWLGFLALRNTPAAQQEIREYASALQTMLTEHFPRTMQLFGENSESRSENHGP